MARVVVEGWAPEYGAPIEPDDALAPAEGSVGEDVETADWRPRDGVDDGVETVAFVDGVRRVDARLVIDDPEAGPIPGICGTYAVGAVAWDRRRPASEVVSDQVARLAVLGGGRAEALPATDLDPPYTSASTPATDPADLLRELHTAMRRAEGAVASELAVGSFVIADGPLNELVRRPCVGLVKTHRVTYLSPERNRVVRELAPGTRTPLFTIADYRRYSWYVRIARVAFGHGWSGIVRCEASGQLPLEEVARLADRTAALLPLVASAPHLDPRAPQNLVPIGALERRLRHRMGDQGLVVRALREAAAREVA